MLKFPQAKNSASVLKSNIALKTKKKPPKFKKIEAMNLKDLYKASPFGMVSSLFYGTIQSALFTLLAVYATSMNFTILEISTFVARGQSYEATQGNHDDLVMNLVMFGYFVYTEAFQDISEC